MTLRHIKIFIEVYQCMNITQAAKKLHMTQPAVTRAIQEIERYYGVQLFERMNHRLYRTESGDELYTSALHITDSFDMMEKSIKNWDELGALRVGGTVTIGNFFLPPAVAVFRQTHPKLELHVTIANAAQLKQGLLENRIDLAIMEGYIPSESLTSEPLGKARLVLILPPGHPLCTYRAIHLEDLAAFPLLLREEGSAGRDFLNHVFGLHELAVEPQWESASTQAIVKAVALGVGISLLPEQLVREDIAAGKVVTRPLADESLILTNHLVWHKKKYLTRSAREFMDLCREMA